MKQTLLILMIFLLSTLNVMYSQDYDEGVKLYKSAKIAQDLGDKEGEQKAWKDAFLTFSKIASKSNYKTVIMCYFTALQVDGTFPHQELLNEYIKSEHPDYPTIQEMKFFGEDKSFVQMEITNIALDNFKQAELYQKEAQDLHIEGMYADAINKIDKSEALWNLPDLATFRQKIKKDWFQKNFGDAQRAYKARNYDKALAKCTEAKKIQYDSNKIDKLIQKIEKKRFSKPQSDNRFAIFFDTGVATELKVDTLNYSWNWSTSYIDVSERGSVASSPTKKSMNSATFGIQKLFSDTLGIMASISFFSQKFDIAADYNFSWLWYSGRSDSYGKSFFDTGNISVTPISLDLLKVFKVGKAGSFSLYFGPSLYMTNINLETNIGYAVVDLKSDGYYYVDWFPFIFKIDEKSNVFGFNMGGDIEFKYGSNLSLYMGTQYFYVPKKEYEWELVNKRYNGEFGYYYVSDPSSWEDLREFKSKINLSTLKFHVGLKLYL